MPHFGLMDEKKLGEVHGPFMRARLHLRGGKRRLRQGKIAAGIVTLYDALEGAMQSYVVKMQGVRLSVQKGENLNDARVLFAVLTRSGVLDGISFDFESFERVTDRALHEEMPEYDYRGLLAGIEMIMTRLGVLPFDEKTLPPEDPETF